MTTLLPIKRAVLQAAPESDAYKVYVEVPDGTFGVPADRTKRHMMNSLGAPCVMTLNFGEISPVAFTLSHAGAQALMDAMWSAGITPTDMSKSGPITAYAPGDSAAQTLAKDVRELTGKLVAAKNEHIEDLRKIAGVERQKDTPRSAAEILGLEGQQF